MTEKIRELRQKFQEKLAGKPLRKAVYLIWQNPYMLAGGDTFIDQLLHCNRFENVATQLPNRYPEVEMAYLQRADFIFLSSEPFPFQDKHVAALQRAFPQAHVRLVNGEYFSWYGSRLLQAFPYFEDLQRVL